MRIDPADVRIDRAEALRYAGYRKNAPSGIFEKLADETEEKIKKVITPRVVFLRADVCVNEEYTEFAGLKIKSSALGRLLKNSSKAYFFAATVGAGVDRLIGRLSRMSAAEGVLVDAYGSAAVEAVCEYACRRFSEIEGKKLTVRFSPGYGDLPIETQPEFLRILDASRRAGITVTASLMMTPVKSVTAIVGIPDK